MNKNTQKVRITSVIDNGGARVYLLQYTDSGRNISERRDGRLWPMRFVSADKARATAQSKGLVVE